MRTSVKYWYVVRNQQNLYPIRCDHRQRDGFDSPEDAINHAKEEIQWKREGGDGSLMKGELEIIVDLKIITIIGEITTVHVL